MDFHAIAPIILGFDVPHFEKMLYDNAQLSLVYLHAYLITGNVSYRQICEETLDFVRNELTHHQGGFYSSLDADSEGEEGKFYLWSLPQIRAVINDEDDYGFLAQAYHLESSGNFEGQIIFQRAMSIEDLADRFAISIPEVTQN